MGACCSGLEEAKESEVPPPSSGDAFTATFQKQGWMDADYDVKGPDGQPWMLMDNVKGMFASSQQYYLKHRAPGQEHSTCLGAIHLDSDFAATDWCVTSPGRKRNNKMAQTAAKEAKVKEWPESDGEDVRFWESPAYPYGSQKVKAQFTTTRRALIFSGEVVR